MSLGRKAAARRELCHRLRSAGGTSGFPPRRLTCGVPAHSPSTCISNNVTYYLLADVRLMIPPTPSTTFIFRLSRMCVALPDVFQSMFRISHYSACISVRFLNSKHQTHLKRGYTCGHTYKLYYNIIIANVENDYKLEIFHSLINPWYYFVLVYLPTYFTSYSCTFLSS